ncbi:KinB activator protein [Bacillus sp. TS-2]|nr:KinB activator protein [Bacillus sp. TS-2]
MIVQAVYKTGVYIGECLEKNVDDNKALIKVLAVKKHPKQGDLHHPNMAEGVFFHQRKALAEFEKAWMPLSSMKDFDGTFLNYKESLKQAWEQLYSQHENQLSPFSQKTIQCLMDLKKDYSLE